LISRFRQYRRRGEADGNARSSSDGCWCEAGAVGSGDAGDAYSSQARRRRPALSIRSEAVFDASFQNRSRTYRDKGEVDEGVRREWRQTGLSSSLPPACLTHVP